MALFGGFALIIPMLIKSLHPTQLTSLLTTSVFVLVVAMLLAAVMDTAEAKDINAATAAYAAVLVVFVGTTNSSSTSGNNANPSTPITGGGKHLNGGTIAGIVVGSVAGMVLLIAFCACCCLKSAIDGILALLGVGRRKRRSTVVEERYVHSLGSFSYYGSLSSSESSLQSADSVPHPPPEDNDVQIDAVPQPIIER